MIPTLPSSQEWEDLGRQRDWLDNIRDGVVYGEAPEAIRMLNATDSIKITNEFNDIIIRVRGKNGAVINAQNPQVSNGAYDGQRITIEGTDDTNHYELNNGNGLQLAGGANIVLKNGDNIQLHYTKSRSIWVENRRSINRT